MRDIISDYGEIIGKCPELLYFFIICGAIILFRWEFMDHQEITMFAVVTLIYPRLVGIHEAISSQESDSK